MNQLLTLAKARPATIGTCWNTASSSPTLTRVDAGGSPCLVAPGYFNAHPIFGGMRRACLNDAGEVVAYHGGPGFAYDGSAGQVMTWIPAFWYRTQIVGANWYRLVSDAPVPGFKLHPGFITDGVAHPGFWCSSFEGSVADGKLQSIAGVKPTTMTSLPNFRIAAHARGAGWELLSFHQVCALELLLLTEAATYNSQAWLGAGVTGITDDATTNMAVDTGYTAGVGAGGADLGSATGAVPITHYQTGQATSPNSYRGIENLYGNVWKWIDGINIKADRNPWIADHDFASDLFAHPYVDSGVVLPTEGYPTTLQSIAALDHAFLAAAVGGSSSTYLCDYYYQAAGNRAARFGGRWSDGAGAGAFCWHLADAASIVYRSIGARLARWG